MKISRAEKNLRNENAVRAFLKGWDDRDVDACMSQCAEHMCYLNQPLEAIRGKENVRKMIASIFHREIFLTQVLPTLHKNHMPWLRYNIRNH